MGFDGIYPLVICYKTMVKITMSNNGYINYVYGHFHGYVTHYQRVYAVAGYLSWLQDQSWSWGSWILGAFFGRWLVWLCLPDGSKTPLLKRKNWHGSIQIGYPKVPRQMGWFAPKQTIKWFYNGLNGCCIFSQMFDSRSVWQIPMTYMTYRARGPAIVFGASTIGLVVCQFTSIKCFEIPDYLHDYEWRVRLSIQCFW